MSGQLTTALTSQQITAIGNGDMQILAEVLSALMRGPQTSAAVNVSVGASPFTYTNTSVYLQQAVIAGGTVSAISLSNGGNPGETTGSWLLRPGDSITVTYSVAPTTFTTTNLI